MKKITIASVLYDIVRYPVIVIVVPIQVVAVVLKWLADGIIKLVNMYGDFLIYKILLHEKDDK